MQEVSLILFVDEIQIPAHVLRRIVRPLHRIIVPHEHALVLGEVQVRRTTAIPIRRQRTGEVPRRVRRPRHTALPRLLGQQLGKFVVGAHARSRRTSVLRHGTRDEENRDGKGGPSHRQQKGGALRMRRRDEGKAEEMAAGWGRMGGL